MRFPINRSEMKARVTMVRFAAALLLFLFVAPVVSAQNLATRWTSFLNGPANRDDDGFAVKVGPDGNVVTTCNSAFLPIGSTTGSYYDIWTVKYDGSTGAQIWQRRSHATNDRSDKVLGMALDAGGNVIVAGLRDGLNANQQSFYAAKYAAANGAVLWERIFNTSCYFVGVAVDSRGDVIATGTARLNGGSPIDSDIYTFKFAGATGLTLWENHYSSVKFSSATTDEAKAIALDADGNAFVTGYATFGQYEETVTLKIDGVGGTTLWSKQRKDNGTSGSSGVDIATDTTGDVLISTTTPQGFGGFRVVKYRGSDGTELWANVQDGPQRDESSSLAIDAQGNVAVTGYTYVPLVTDYDIFTRKMNGSTGQTLWTKIYDGGVKRDDRGVSVRFDAAGNTVVAGYSGAASGNGPDTMILRYAPDGTVLSQQRIEVSNGGDFPGSKDSLVVGPGHITVVGGSYTRNGDDAYTLRLNDPAKPSATTVAANNVTGVSATLKGIVSANGSSASARFEYGTVANNLTVSTAVQQIGNGFGTVSVQSVIAGLLPGTTYYFRARADANGQTQYGETLSFTTLSDNAKLAALSLSTGALSPTFDKLTTSYITTVPFSPSGLTVTPTTDYPGASVKVNGTGVASGTASGNINLPVGNTTIVTTVTAEDGIATKTYTITVTRLPESFIFDSATSIPVTANGFSTGGYPVNFVLNYPPVPGTVLTAVNNTGLAFIDGTFGNLAHGQHVPLTFNGVTYDFVANYFGGTGNDLVLQWAATGIYAWGSNNYGQLGDNSTTGRLVPVATDGGGVLAGRTVVSTGGGYLHSLALCSDGTLAAWGYNVYGQLGNDGNAASSVPVEVDRSGALVGKTVIAISAGPFHNLALCSDGSIVAWGYNNYGQLGTGDKVTRRTPALVVPAGALVGKQVVGIAAGAYHSFARCADGSVVAWGYNDEGELGDNSTTIRLVPVVVDASGALAGKKVASISAGQYHTLALCTDGTLVAWGYNQHGELGNNTVISSKIPVAINSFGALAGRTVSTVATGGTHSLALCTDGTLVAWGLNNKTQLGVGGIGQSTVPVSVAPLGKAINTIVAGGNHSIALSSDGSLSAWGDNSNGQLGNNTTTTSESPSLVDSANFPAGSRIMLATTGSAALHSLAIVGLSQSSAGSGIQPFDSLAGSNQGGISNLIERAFALDPAKDSSRELPQPQRIGDNYVIEFSEPENLTSITYGAESSLNLQPGSWQTIKDSGSGTHHIFSVPANGTKSIFFRLKVSE